MGGSQRNVPARLLGTFAIKWRIVMPARPLMGFGLRWGNGKGFLLFCLNG